MQKSKYITNTVASRKNNIKKLQARIIQNNHRLRLVVLIYRKRVSSAIIHFLMASASIYNAINWLTPAQFIAMTAWLGFAGFIGGVDIYGRR
jgi:hypothetical protein